MTINSPSESNIQSSYILWLNLQFPLIADLTFAFANGGNRPKKTVITRSGAKRTFCPSGKRLQREGVKKGLPDVGLFWPVLEKHGMFIEFKSLKGRLSKEQADIINKLKSQDYFCVVCHNLEEAINATIKYIGGTFDE